MQIRDFYIRLVSSALDQHKYYDFEWIHCLLHARTRLKMYHFFIITIIWSNEESYAKISTEWPLNSYTWPPVRLSGRTRLASEEKIGTKQQKFQRSEAIFETL